MPYSTSRIPQGSAPSAYPQQTVYEAGYPVSFETKVYEPTVRNAKTAEASRRNSSPSPPPPPPPPPTFSNRQGRTIGARHLAYMRREASDHGAGGPFSNEFRIVKPFTFVPRGLSRDGTSSSTAVASGDVLSDSESPLPDVPDDIGMLGTTDVDEANGPPDHAQNIYRSLYTGDAYYDGSHTAELSTLFDPQKGSRPLFRWLWVDLWCLLH